MLVQLAIQAHEHLFAPLLALQEEELPVITGNDPLCDLGHSLRSSMASETLAWDLTLALAELLPEGFEQRLPLARELAQRSPSIQSPDGPVLTRWAIGAALAHLVLPQVPLEGILYGDGSFLADHPLEDQLEIATKAVITLEILRRPSGDLIPWFWQRTRMRGACGRRSRLAPDILFDLNTWRRPLAWRSAVPQNGALGLLAERAAPAVLAQSYVHAQKTPEDLATAISILEALWPRLVPEGTPPMSRTAVAFCLLAVARRHSSPASILGDDFHAHLQQLLGEDAVAAGDSRLGKTGALHSSV